MKTTTLAIAAAMAAGTLAHAQDADCNVNGIPDATEIAQGLADDCNANGIPDVCEYAGVMLEAEQPGFGNGSPLIATFTEVDHAISDVRLDVAVRADLDSVGEFVQAKVGGSVVATIWVTGGQACPSEVQSQTVLITAATFNASIANGTVVVSLEPSGVVSVKECPSSFASLAAEYVSSALPADCFGNGVWDECDLAADPSLDCDGNGLIDSCEIDDAPSLDCDSNGQLDSCEITAGTTADCDANGVPDTCDPDCDTDGVPDACSIASGQAADCNLNGRPDSCDVLPGTYLQSDCDADGIPDDCQISQQPDLDKNGDRVLDSCQYARGDLNLDLSVDSSDLSVLLGLWGSADSSIGDLNSDGMIDGADLGVLLLSWGTYSAPWATVLTAMPDPTVVVDPSLRNSIVDTGLPWRVRDNRSGIELLLIPGGDFMMGCSASLTAGCTDESELPIHLVTITSPFYLGRFETTQAQWLTVMGSNPSFFQGFDDSAHRPVEQISWDMVQLFEAATDFRLPTEAEWEYACRAGTDTAYNNGSNDDSTLDQLAWYANNNGPEGSPGYGTKSVGQKAPNRLGIHDMHGNVWEMCEDWHGWSYYQYSPQFDPPGPTSSIDNSRVQRGGSCFNLWGLRSGSRYYGVPYGTSMAVGFRVARTP